MPEILHGILIGEVPLFLSSVMGYPCACGDSCDFLLLDLSHFSLSSRSTEKFTIDEVKQFYKDHSSTVFYVVYGSFTQVEQTILDRGMQAWSYHIHTPPPSPSS